MLTQMSRIKKFTNGFFYERLTIYSLLFLLVALSLDCFCQCLPITGYRLLLTNLLLIGFTTFATCHGIKWAITTNKPIQIYFLEKCEIKILINFLKKYETNFSRRLKNNLSFESFKYSTNVNEQIRLLLKDIERNFIKIWYSNISENPSFLFDSHLILEEICYKIIARLKILNLRNLVISILIIYLSYLQQYKKLKKKLLNLKILGDIKNKPKIEILDLYQFLHPASNNDHILNYYLKKMTKSTLKEFASQEFSNSLECKILTGIIGKKVLRKFLVTLEDPNFINLKLIYLFDEKKHKKLLQGKVYSIGKKPFDLNEDNADFKKFLFMNKRFFPINIFETSKNLCDSIDSIKGSSANKLEEIQHKEKIFKQDLQICSDSNTEKKKKKNFNVLYNLSPSSAESLPIESVFIQCPSNNKIQKKLTIEKKNYIFETITVPLNNQFQSSNKEMKENKIFTRSKSSESLTTFEGFYKDSGAVIKERSRKISDFTTERKSFKKLTKTQSIEEEDVLIDTLTKNEVTPNSVNDSPLFNCKRDVSPEYEEPEDFATTIAKLRRLIQQRESTTLLLNKSVLSDDSQCLTTTFEKQNNKNQSSEESFHNFSIEECEVPKDRRIFLNISIPKTELISDHGQLPYILYYIQYNEKNKNYTSKHQEVTNCNRPQLVQTTTIKRRFKDFLDLQTKLEENVNFKYFMKEIQGPKKCSNFYFNEEYLDSSTSSERSILEIFLRQLCSNESILNSSEFQEFLHCDSNETVSFPKKDPDFSLQRLDKLLSNKFTGVFNSLRTVFPTFDFETSPLVITTDKTKNFDDQKLLQNFPNFGSKQELFDQQFNFVVLEPSGDTLVDDIRQYLRGKSENIEDAVDALSSTDWLSEKKECRFLSSEKKCLWYNFKGVALDDEFELLDSMMPICSLLLDILSELLQDTDSWIIKEPAIRLLKVIFGHLEYQLQKELSKKDWNLIIGNLVRMLRSAFFQTVTNDKYDFIQNDTDVALKKIIYDLMPSCLKEFIKPEDLFVGVSLFVDSFQISKLNRDILLKLFDLLIVHLLPCHHIM